MIGPWVKVKLADGSKVKVEAYHRPPIMTVTVDKGLVNEREIRAIRVGPDEYAEKVVSIVDSK